MSRGDAETGQSLETQTALLLPGDSSSTLACWSLALWRENRPSEAMVSLLDPSGPEDTLPINQPEAGQESEPARRKSTWLET